MTDIERAQVKALALCTFSPGSSPKRFIRDLAAREGRGSLTEKQAAFLDSLAHQYRKQLGACMSKKCAACGTTFKVKRPATQRKVHISAVLEFGPYSGLAHRNADHKEPIHNGVPLCGARTVHEARGRDVFRSHLMRPGAFANLPPTMQCKNCKALYGVTRCADEVTVISIEAALVGLARVFA